MATKGAAPLPGVAMGEQEQAAGRSWVQATRGGAGLPPADAPAPTQAPAPTRAPARPGWVPKSGGAISRRAGGK